MTLKPCPFCGSEDVVLVSGRHAPWYYTAVSCRSCEMEVTRKWGGLINGWNRREKE